MVHREVGQRKTLRLTTKNIVFGIFLFVLASMIMISVFSLCLYIFKKNLTQDIQSGSKDAIVSSDNTVEEPEIIEETTLIDFQPIVDDFIGSSFGDKSVLVYDLENMQSVGEFNPDRVFNTASLYKLFVVYEGYRKVQNGEWERENKVYNTGKTIIECLDLSIRESNSECAESLLKMIGRDKLNNIVKTDFNISSFDVFSLSSTPKDILKMMQLFFSHTDITDKTLIATMKDSFINQNATVYDWRQGLPSGFHKANVYNKVGWDYNAEEGYWNLYHDAAIIEFPEQNRHYIIVVMTTKTSFNKIAEFGSHFEDYFYNNQ